MTDMWSCQTRIKLQRWRIRSRTSSCSVLSCAHSRRTSVRWVFSDPESEPLRQPAKLPDISYKSTSSSALQFDVRTRHGRTSDAKEKILRTPDRTEKRCRPPRKVADTSRFRASAARPPRLNVAREPPAAEDRRPTTVPTDWLCWSALVTHPHQIHTTLHSQWPKHTVRALRDRRRLTWFQPWAPAFRRATRLSPPA